MSIKFHDSDRIFHTVGEDNVVFEASNQDLSDSTYQYFGYISVSGSWIIQRFKISGSTIIYSYFGGQTRTDYDALWNADGTLKATGIALTFTTYDKIATL